MMSDTSWHNAALALRLLALDPIGLGGAVIRMRAGPARKALLAQFTPAWPVRKLPISISDEQLRGGLDLTASLSSGQLIEHAGFFGDPCVALVPMAERCSPTLAAKLAAQMDAGVCHGIVLLDEGIEPEEAAPPGLAERCAFHLCPEGRAPSVPAGTPAPNLDGGALNRADALAQLTALAAAFGIPSLRAPTLALRTACAHAALCGRAALTRADVEVAATLVYPQRATRVPEPADETAPADPPPPGPDTPDTTSDSASDTDALADTELMIDAVKAALPQGILDGLVPTGTARPSSGTGAGETRKSNRRGRPLPSRRGRLDGTSRIDVIATLRAAAPWQPIRRALQPTRTGLHIRPSDIHLKRYAEHSDRLLIFSVDASGSAAMSRLGEAKGAIELLLAEAYASRDHVALVAFRGAAAETLLPPTRSLVQTKRRLAALPGGGGTPLASGLKHALDLAEQARGKGMTPTVVLVTDGRANIALDGSAGRDRADADARTVAATLRGRGVASLVLDMSPRPHAALQSLGAVLGGPYIPLPRADAHRLTEAVTHALES